MTHPHLRDARATPARPDAWRYRWTILGVATFTQAAAAFFVQGIGALGITLQRDLDLTTAQVGLLLSAAQLVPLVGLLVAGELLDRHDERWVVGIGASLVGVALLAGSAAPGYPALLLVLLLVGVGYSTVQPGGSKAVAAWFAPSQRGFAMGIRQAGLPLGAALASATLPFLPGWRAALATGGLVALLGAAAFLGFSRRPPDRPASREPQPSLRTQVNARLRMLREPSMIKIMLSGTSLISVQCGVGILTALHLHEHAGATPGTAALVLVAAQAAGVAGRIALAAWSDRRSSRHTTVLACMAAVIAAMAALATPLGHSAVASALLFGWLGFFGIGWYGPWVAYVTESAPPDRTGFALGLAMSVNQVAIVLVPPLLGVLKDVSHGFALPWATLAAMTLTALLTTAYAERRGRRAGRGNNRARRCV